jgi:predicted transcriptional regulator
MQYRKLSFSRVLDHYFDDSVENLLSFMVKEKKLSAEDIQKIEQLIKKHEDHE